MAAKSFRHPFSRTFARMRVSRGYRKLRRLESFSPMELATAVSSTTNSSSAVISLPLLVAMANSVT